MTSKIKMVFRLLQWLEGAFDNKEIASRLGEQPVKGDELKLFASQAMVSMFQFIRYAGFKGTVVCFDEADIGFQQPAKDKIQKILALFKGRYRGNKRPDWWGGVFVYALTDEVVHSMMQYMALKQRIDSPPERASWMAMITLP